MPSGSPPFRVACVGASVTFGLGLPERRQRCYPAVLQRLLDQKTGQGACRVRNFGYSGGAVSRGSNEPYRKTPSFTAAERFESQLVVMMLGTNDAQFANEAARSTFAPDLADLVDHFRSAGAEVLVGDPPPAFPPVEEIDFDALEQAVRPAIRRVAEEIDAPLVDFYTPLLDARAEFPDGLHPTAVVAERLAEIALEAVLPYLPAGRDS